jgi:hypothetical protein
METLKNAQQHYWKCCRFSFIEYVHCKLRHKKRSSLNIKWLSFEFVRYYLNYVITEKFVNSCRAERKKENRYEELTTLLSYKS